MRVNPTSGIYHLYRCPVCKVSHGVGAACKQGTTADKPKMKKDENNIKSNNIFEVIYDTVLGMYNAGTVSKQQLEEFEKPPKEENK